ncbi:TIGR03364 family FAD-dependent oxidoreductase [uncultured Roseovarius sp.]|uniref:TIGR03364 family FAD-dependent oxidoreductase n=1 Tax=uncultured Roseovarius sp. TaxID=293344 RepID=UPI002634B907|nr:TIGR03364 family FAD-dependent oxidoreductase [uncultured Roseovarius sp.]
MTQYDVAIIGAGIIGLTHAYHATRAGLKVAVFEREPQAQGASVRNFGMLAIVAQAPGAQLDSARRTLACWKDLAPKAGITLRQAGCVFLARAPEEMAVLEECAARQNETGHRFDRLTAAVLADHVADLPAEDYLGGLHSPDAWKVDQRQALSRLSDWLQREHGVAFHFSTPAEAVQTGRLKTPAGTFRTGHTILCGGDDFCTIFPEAFRAANLGRCRLQMLRTVPQPDNWQLSPFVLGGLSVTRYGTFNDCPSLPALKAYQQKNFADHLAHGIHVIACQEADGSITIGDSHAYDTAGECTRSDEVDRLILEELSQMIALPDPRIADRWLGHYAHSPDGETRVLTPDDKVTAVTMTNGQGMTHGFAVAEKVIQNLFG